MSDPIVRLISHTLHPIEVMLYAFRNMHGSNPDSLEELMASGHITSELKKDFVEYLAAEPLGGGVQEFVSTVWLFRNVSRAFQQQLTRHRTAAYSIQSLRIVDKMLFATREDYHLPENTKDPVAFAAAMMRTEQDYQDLLYRGEKAEVARGVLPLNICSPITMCINLRNLSSLLSSRLCRMSQGEIRTAAEMMVREVVGKMGEEFGALFSAPCEPTGFCSHAEGCGHRPKFPFCEGKHTESIKQFVRR